MIYILALGCAAAGVIVGVLITPENKANAAALDEARWWRKRAETKELARFYAADEAAQWQALAMEQKKEIEQLTIERDGALERYQRAIDTHARRQS